MHLLFQMPLSLAALALATSLTAQRTWVVDANNGPGTDFVDLPPAIAQAVDGDIVTVRSGTYRPFVTSKGLSLLGESGATIASSISDFCSVSNLAAGKRFVMRGITFTDASPFSLSSYYLVIDQCRGAVHLDGLATAGVRSVLVLLRSCGLVTVSHITATSGIEIESSRVSLHDASLQVAGLAAALRLTNSTVEATEVNLRGSPGHPHINPYPGVLMLSSTLEVRGTVASLIAGGTASSAQAPAIWSDGPTLRLDPKIRLIGGIEGVTPTIAAMPALRVVSGQLGGTKRFDLSTQPQQLAVIFGALPMNPIDTNIGRVWLDLPTLFVVGAMVVDASGTWRLTTPNPSLPSLRGLAITYQALDIGPQATTVSNAATLVLH